MGAFLDKPITVKDTIVEESKSINSSNIRYVVSSMQGWRAQMEDAHIHKIGIPLFGPALPPCSIGLFGVFDGHGGNLISNYVADTAMDTFLQVFNRKVTTLPKKGFVSNEILAQSLGQTFLVLDEAMKELPEVKEGQDNSGSTAVCAMITKDAYIVANLGDSRCVVIGQRGIVKFASEDHKPSLPEETERITKAGGFVASRRINGDLAVSRGLGDYRYKMDDSLPAENQILSPVPDITIVPREDGDLFVVLACDGLWDVMSNEDCGHFLMDQIREGKTMKEAAERLLDHTLELNSRDNVTLIAVALPASCDLYNPLGIEENEMEIQGTDYPNGGMRQGLSTTGSFLEGTGDITVTLDVKTTTLDDDLDGEQAVRVEDDIEVNQST